ncbi:MAG: DinB family protein [Spirochaetales bacterium]|nr:DinB family protein [Spirochaetales bacterium]
MISESIKKQSKQIFQNIEAIFDVVNEENIFNMAGVFPIWKQLYHLLHSMDQNFVNPSDFTEPRFHSKNLNVIFMDTGNSLSRQQLWEYFLAVRKKIETYISGLNDDILEEIITFRDMRLTKMELIIAQFRHIFYHIGYIHCCFKILNGETPEYIGLYKVIPEK